ncbi:hypothetical protein FA15DRAFT_672529 [Coprinopsis marcescibilis]|uniref:Large ribosomal subunit protein uL30m n=1 Tax=Coprinopsis marcescibilis TaxID=230819 RepID=A0A5C3KN66_COPMA|nr:hypothetical protein FA15DRAFT_672529 [Coprinopsis marcescibilis]
MSGILAHSAAKGFVSTRYAVQRTAVRTLATSSAVKADTAPAPSEGSENSPGTHFKVTLKRSAISLGDKKKGTLLALGFHRRFQTVYHRHTPEAAGKILAVKELVEVENVPDHLVKTKQQMRQDRKALRGYKVVSNRTDSFLNI